MAASTAGTGGGGSNEAVKDAATARQLTRRLGHSSRGSNCSTLTASGLWSGSTAAAEVASPPDPAPQVPSPPPPTPLAAVVATLEDEPCSSCGGTAETAAKPPSPILLSLPRGSKQQQTALGALAETSAPSNPSSVGGEDSGCEMPIQLLPGLLPVVSAAVRGNLVNRVCMLHMAYLPQRALLSATPGVLQLLLFTNLELDAGRGSRGWVSGERVAKDVLRGLFGLSTQFG